MDATSRATVMASIAGILTSTYALYVEMSAEAKPGYKAVCDFSENASCSRVLSSKYAKGFGVIPANSAFFVPNTIYGTIFYCLMIFLATYDEWAIVRLQFVLAAASVLSCFYMAYLLAFVLKDFCLVCVSTYVFNFIIVYNVWLKMQMLEYKMK